MIGGGGGWWLWVMVKVNAVHVMREFSSNVSRGVNRRVLCVRRPAGASADGVTPAVGRHSSARLAIGCRRQERCVRPPPGRRRRTPGRHAGRQLGVSGVNMTHRRLAGRTPPGNPTCTHSGRILSLTVTSRTYALKGYFFSHQH